MAGVVAFNPVVVEGLVRGSLALAFTIVRLCLFASKLLVVVPQADFCLHLPLLNAAVAFRADVSVDKAALDLLTALSILAVLLLLCVLAFGRGWLLLLGRLLRPCFDLCCSL